jgi:hypothetical protein
MRNDGATALSVVSNHRHRAFLMAVAISYERKIPKARSGHVSANSPRGPSRPSPTFTLGDSASSQRSRNGTDAHHSIRTRSLLEKGLSTAAVIAALSTLACCVPLGFLGAIGLASLSVWAQPLRPWLLGTSVVLLAVGFVQLHVRKSTCARRSTASLVIFWTAAGIVLSIVLFPQVVASLIAR